MKYMGSKNRIAKYILPIMLKDRKENQYWVEPFVGGANMIDKVDGLRIGADFNAYNICLFKGIQDDFIPPDYISEHGDRDCRSSCHGGRCPSAQGPRSHDLSCPDS